MPISIFGFQALWSPYFLALLLLLTVLYFFVTIKWRNKFEGSEPLKKHQAALFVTSMVVLYAVKGSPIDLLGHIMFTYHMIQMAILYLVVAPLFLRGVPWWVWKKVIDRPVIKPVFNFFTKPLIALVLFNGLFSIYHLPIVFDYIKMSMVLHTLYTIGLFIFALFMWWPLVNDMPEGRKLNGLKKVGYIFADGVLLTPACGLIIFASAPVYATYSDAGAWLQAMELCVPTSTLQGLSLSGPELFSSMPVMEDQQLGGVIMKIIQEIVYGCMLAFVFFEWVRKDKEETEKMTAAMMNNHQPDYTK
ncbi:cytochrome c oxidase assembly factor CtaG [Bacillus badius]|uniref:CtaG protein n=1 Tax=Bacillus badius TaxID=1455 RepID=A0ABR5B0B5_BACBA|nr:cytochrome c oxidase assembly factor CtaG [Bacillus badius]KIL73443.1 CtaG protein [Bacillus badius]KIL80452.1 CtaG protein [Bacillus badius]KZO01555.1 cytochrome c oxidase assembly factor CtaG [Bacillus badius]KZR57266.1 cytochrome c oxidase assembly factor CtaG [Bacillus badius]MED0667199.1 cytochrome c oxidase assembly factor CtaG [Bacillus badius]